jgi:Ca-activated chloride channel family protein
MPIPFLPNHQFAFPWYLLLLLGLPLLAWLRGRAGSAPAVVFPGVALLQGLGRRSHSRAGGFSMNLLHASLALAIIALARPQRVVSYEEVKSEGIAIVVACDVSLSMRIQDFYIGGMQVNRLTAAKRVLTDFIKGRPMDRIGIVAFAGAPYKPCPPTLDHDWILNNMDRIDTGLIEDGTAIGSGIAAAARQLDEQKVRSKVIVLLTDGANNSGKLSPQDAAELAVSVDPPIRIHTVSIGTPGMHLIRLPSGQIINSHRQEFDPETLEEVARIGGGTAHRAEDLSTLENIFRTIDELEKTEITRRKIMETQELFVWFLVPAMALCGIYLLWKLTFGRMAPAVA